MRSFGPWIIACLALNAAAQPTLTAADMPMPGQSVVYRLFDTIPPPASGENVIWEIHGNGSIDDSVAFFSAPGQPGFEDFPDATLMMTMTLDPSYRSYYKTTDSTFEYLGYHFVGDESYFDDPGVHLRFPCTYGSTWSDTWGPVDETIDVDFVADGWGTLMSGSASWSNVMKVHGSSLELDTVVNSIHYQSFVSMDFFWSPGEPFYLAYVHHRDYLVDGIPDPDITKTHARVRRELVTGMMDRSPLDVLTVFPNPAADVLHVSTNLPDPATITLMDMTGREVWRDLANAQPRGIVRTVDVQGLVAGSYVVRCDDRSGRHHTAAVVVH